MGLSTRVDGKMIVRANVDECSIIFLVIFIMAIILMVSAMAVAECTTLQHKRFSMETGRTTAAKVKVLFLMLRVKSAKENLELTIWKASLLSKRTWGWSKRN